MTKVLGLIILGCIFGLRIALADLHPKFQADFEKKKVQEYDHLELNCSASGAQPLNYTWYDTSEKKINSETIITTQSSANGEINIVKDDRWSSLSIKNVSSTDGGIYTCTAANAYGLASKLFQVSVGAGTANFRIIQLESVEVPVGGQAVIVCKVEGTPKPNVIFKRDNDSQDILSRKDSRIQVTQTDEDNRRITTLRISGVKRSDDGLYVCYVWNTDGTAQNVSHLQVQFSPEISVTLGPVYLYPPKVVNLTCSATAIPNATLTWYFAKDLVKGEDYKIIGELSYSTLMVRARYKPEFKNYGFYECVAHNALGINATEVEVKEGKVPGEIDQVLIQTMTATSITFDFVGPKEEKELPVLYYSVSYKNLDNPALSLLNIFWKKGSTYIVKDLIPATQYRFSFSASNDVGMGPSRIVQYKTLPHSVPEPPRILTKQETISEYTNMFTVEWLVPNDNGFPILHFNIAFYKVAKEFIAWIQQKPKTVVIIRNWFGNPSLTLTNLTASSFYKVEIMAANKMGNSRPSSVVFRTNEEPIPDKREVTVPTITIILAIVGLFILYVIIDVISFFTCRCGLIHLIRRGKCKG